MSLRFYVRTLSLRVFLTLVLLGTFATGALSECLVPPPPCIALEKSAIVFVGDVTSVGAFNKQTGPNEFQFVPQPVRFRVIERFKGIPKGQTEVDGAVRLNPEAIMFASGFRYVVYASLASDGTWNTTCSRTCTVKQCPDDIRQLRLCKHQAGQK